MRDYDEYRQILTLWEQGYAKKRIGIMLNIPRRTVIDCIQRFQNLKGLENSLQARKNAVLEALQNAEYPTSPLHKTYAYLLGVYLGDGCISIMRNTPRIRITLGTIYPNLIQQCVTALQIILPENKVDIVRSATQNCVQVSCYSNTLLELFPQHVAGKKHDRSIMLTDWQQRMVDTHPLEFFRGLYHTDGSRFNNVIMGGYTYVRYQFTNSSADILNLFTATCDKLGLHWTVHVRKARKVTHHDATDILISRRADVEYLDSVIGAKS